MIIYHGHPSPKSVEAVRQHAPSHTHGAEWSHQKMTPHDWPYILDNGAFAAYANNEPWDVDAFVGRLSQLETMPRDPDFVVLPDVVTNPEQTRERATKWAGVIDYPTAYPVQDGVTLEDAVEIADRLDAGTLFVGGTVDWKRRHAESFVETAHAHDLRCHIGRPGDLVWADEIGADSVDTTSIVINQSWHRLERLEASTGQASIESGAWS
jgi:hypothetical protein